VLRAIDEVAFHPAECGTLNTKRFPKPSDRRDSVDRVEGRGEIPTNQESWPAQSGCGKDVIEDIKEGRFSRVVPSIDRLMTIEAA
jgi:hypothetical protein